MLIKKVDRRPTKSFVVCLCFVLLLWWLLLLLLLCVCVCVCVCVYAYTLVGGKNPKTTRTKKEWASSLGYFWKKGKHLLEERPRKQQEQQKSGRHRRDTFRRKAQKTTHKQIVSSQTQDLQGCLWVESLNYRRERN